jgi:hypothetical protein
VTGDDDDLRGETERVRAAVDDFGEYAVVNER